MKFPAVLGALILTLATLTGAAQVRSTENVGMGVITIIELGNNGDIWAGSQSQGAGFYNGTTQSWTYFTKATYPKMQSDSITSLTFGLINGTQHAYIGTRSGLVDIRAGVVDTIQVPRTRHIGGVSLVGGDTLWVATDSGIVVLDTAKNVISSLTTLNSNIPYNRMNTSQKGGKNCVGFAAGTPNNGAFYTKDYTTFVKIDTSAPNFRLVDNRVNTLTVDNNCNRYLIGTKGGASFCPVGTPCQNFTTANGLPQNDVTTIAIDCHGAIWIGMRDSGIVIYNNSGFTRLSTADGLSDNHITSIGFDGMNCNANIAGRDGNISIVDSAKHLVNVLNAVSEINADQLDVAVYPQPAAEMVNFLLGKELATAELTLTDLSGRAVETIAIHNTSNAVADVSVLPQGLYFYRLNADGQQLKAGKVQVMR